MKNDSESMSYPQRIKYRFLSVTIITQRDVREIAKKCSIEIRIYCSVAFNSGQQFIYVSAVFDTSSIAL
jgi:hypothetical protein